MIASEFFLHWLWQNKLIDPQQLVTTQGEKITIIKTGSANEHDGPDFLNAAIKIENTLWAGHVEMHINSSDFTKHGHYKDPNYKNIILHIVWLHDKESVVTCPTLALSGKVPQFYLQNYLALKNSKKTIPCHAHLHQINQLNRLQWLDALLWQRLGRKATLLLNIASATNYHWEQLFFISLAQSFGMKVNAEAMLQWATSIPFEIILKHKNNLMQLEALFIGQAGLLSEVFEETYALQLQREYDFLKHKYSLQTMNKSAWKFAKLRPPNFPTIRMAQLAQLYHQQAHLFSALLEAPTAKHFMTLFQLKASTYWHTHFTLNKLSQSSVKQLGKATIDSIFINTCSVVLYGYGQYMQKEEWMQKAINFLQTITAEQNAITKTWKTLGLQMPQASDSQALIELYNEYCTPKKCLLCNWGKQIIQSPQGV
jgi:hypothetical protein